MDVFEKVLPKLIKIPIFSDFTLGNAEDERILKLVYDNLSLESFSKGETIIKEGSFGDKFYILYKGKVQVLRNTPAGDVIALADLSSEDDVFFGETALICQDEARSASVKALSDGCLIVLSSKKFIALCDKEPLLGYRVVLRIARGMSKTIRETNNDKAALYEALFTEIEEGGY